MKKNKILDNKKIHFVGIGGIGMSGIAHVLLEMGYDVSGSDLEMNNVTRKLEAIGARICKGHSRTNLPDDAQVLVYSSSIGRDNPEMAEAQRRGIKIAHRAEALGELFNKKDGIAVTGTHGKTTTTSLISVMLKECGLDPTVVIGGEVSHFKGNACLGKGAYFVAEADESDSSFLQLKPRYSVVTNIEMEHLDHFKSMTQIRAAYLSFINNTKPGGIVFYNGDDANMKDVLKKFRGKSASFGFSKNADIRATDIKMDGFETSFVAVYKNKVLGGVKLNIPGAHNVLNALAAILVSLKLGLEFKDIIKGLKSFEGTKRRFQLRSNSGGVMLIDDYAHHPTEIKAVLDACRNWKGKRVVAIFQPHRYTRTKFLAGEFGASFKNADKLILTDIYAASEKAIKGVSIKNIYDKVKANGAKDVTILAKKDIVPHVMKLKRRGDMIVVMGAGDIKKVADELCENLEAGSSIRGELAEKIRNTIKGKVTFGEPLSMHTSFRIGGPADLWIEPEDAQSLKKVLKLAKSYKAGIFVIGNGTNVLASDSGCKGILLHLRSGAFKVIKIDGVKVRAGAGYSLPKLVREACEKGLEGIESLVGIPGTLGGAIYMNAGGWNNPVYKNIGDVVESLKVMDYNGHVKTLRKKDIEFGYRRTNLKPYIILEATLKLIKSDKENLVSSCSRFLKMKRDKQVLDIPSAGCVFKNPENFQFTCGQMIDMLGLKGKSMGGAQVSVKHANFIVNRGGATCKDVLSLAEFIKKKVKTNCKVDLDLEIKVI